MSNRQLWMLVVAILWLGGAVAGAAITLLIQELYQ